jgi:hypothetical protein
MYSFLNIFFFVFHSFIVLLFIFGWMWKKTRLANLILIVLTSLSWFFIGIWYGYGYCPCTDWHWHARRELGIYDSSTSYLEFLFEELTGLDVSRTLVDRVAAASLVVILCLSIALNIRDFKKRKGQIKPRLIK